MLKFFTNFVIYRVKAVEGLYSELYILTDFDFDVIINLLRTDRFINKSGGYYTYNSKDLESYRNY